MNNSDTPNPLTHLDGDGNARMVDVTDKDVTFRVATAEGEVNMQPETLRLIVDGKHAKGDVMAVARIAGIQAAKKCADLIPLCHPLALSAVRVELQPDVVENLVRITATCKLSGKTGVEMEALNGVNAGLLTIYDMCKAVDRGMTITDIQLLEKSGGRSGDWRRET